MTIATTETKTVTPFGSVGITAAEIEGIVTGTFPGIPDEYTDAEILDHNLRTAFSVSLTVHHYLTKVVEEAKAAKIHETLHNPETGKRYRSWTDYITSVLAAQDLDVKSLSAKDKQFLCVLLFNMGMSQQGIAKGLSISAGTVNNAVKKGRELGTVKADRETTAADGRTYKNTEDNGAKGDGKEVAKQVLAARRAISAIKSVTTAVAEAEMDEETAALVASYVKEMQAALTALKKAAK